MLKIRTDVNVGGKTRREASVTKFKMISYENSESKLATLITTSTM
jgi:hypothetical protein